VYANGEADQECDEDEPAERVFFIGHQFPFQDGPEGDGSEGRRHGVDFAFGGGEPERVGEGEGHGADKSGTEEHDHLVHGITVGGNFDKFTGEQGDGPEQEKDSKGAGEGRHEVDHHGHFGSIAECQQGESPADELEGGCARRVAYLQFIRRGDVFPAVPPACSWFQGQHINNKCDKKRSPAENGIPAFKILMRHHVTRFGGANLGRKCENEIISQMKLDRQV